MWKNLFFRKKGWSWEVYWGRRWRWLHRFSSRHFSRFWPIINHILISITKQEDQSDKILKNNIYREESESQSLGIFETVLLESGQVSNIFEGNLYDGMKHYQPIFRERESFSSVSGNILEESCRHQHQQSVVKQSMMNYDQPNSDTTFLCLDRLNNIANSQTKQNYPARDKCQEPGNN